MGSTFTLDLPVALLQPTPGEPQQQLRPHQPGTPRPNPNPHPHPAFPDLGGVRVLVVDDEPDSRALISRLLRECRADVKSAESADEGLKLFRTMRPDIVLSDIGMPGRDGYEFIRNIRALSYPEGGSTPAAALTALARTEDRTRALMAGFQVHVSKPIEPSELIAVVANLAKLSPKS
jgi:CheY-like chemotaxis protein